MSKTNTGRGGVRIYTSVFNHLDYCVVINQEQMSTVAPFEKFMSLGTDSQTDFVVRPGKRPICVVQMNKEDILTDPVNVALLVHESVHVWQHIARLMGETNPSVEFEAYSIQQIVVDLMHSFNRAVTELRDS